MLRYSAAARAGLPAWCLCIGPALAPALGRFDANGDRAISEQEAEGCEGLSVVFERLDLDAYGFLSRAEYAAFADVWRRLQHVFTDPD